MSPRLELTDEEVVLLDGRCSPEVQVEVEKSRDRLALTSNIFGLTKKQALLIADVVLLAKSEGYVICRGDSIRYCEVCEKSAGYAKHKRSGRYHRAGQDNRDRPLTFRGVEFKDSFVRIQNHVSLGCCYDCFQAIKDNLHDALALIKAEVPEAITGFKPKWKRWRRHECTKCGWQGHEGDLGKLRTLLSDGYYRGQCPKCPAKNEFMSHPIKMIDGFDVVPAEEPKLEV